MVDKRKTTSSGKATEEGIPNQSTILTTTPKRQPEDFEPPFEGRTYVYPISFQSDRIAKGVIPHRRIGKQFEFKISEVDVWVDSDNNDETE